MGYIEITKVTTKTSIRIQDGVMTKGGVRRCDGCNLERSDIGGVEQVINSDLTLWLCFNCNDINSLLARQVEERK